MGAHSTDFITGCRDVELPATPFRGRMLIDGAWVEAADGERIVRESPAHGVAVSSYPSAKAAAVGTVWINSFMDGYAELPFGGYRDSGIGRELGRKALEDYTETKTVQMHIGPRTGWWLPR